jgi:hypothetical protein
MYDALGFNKILNVFFHEELLKLKREGLDISKIKPLVLVNIDTLIFISDILKEKKCSLKEIVEHFHANSNPPKDRQVTENEITDSLMPFSSFCLIYVEKKLGGNWRSENLYHYLFEKI